MKTNQNLYAPSYHHHTIRVDIILVVLYWQVNLGVWNGFICNQTVEIFTLFWFDLV